MTELEEQLRYELRSVAERAKPESLRPLRIPPPRRRARAVRWLAPVAAAAAVAAVIVGVTVAGHKTGQQPLNQLPAGAPKYYVTLNRTSPDVISAVVRSSVSGAPISSVQLLRSRSIVQPLAIIAGASDDRAFLISIPGALEILRLAPNGHVLRLTRLPKSFWNLAGIYAAAFGTGALSPDGTQVMAPFGRPYSCKSCAHGVAMLSVTTGVTRKWLLPSGDEDVWGPVSWPGSGHEVLLTGGLGLGYRLLDVARPGDSLLASARKIHASTLSARVAKQGWMAYGGGSRLLPGDKTLVTAYDRLSAGRHGKSTETALIRETSASTGRLVGEITFSERLASNAGMGCYLESFGPSGMHVLIWFADGFGRLDGSHFTPLPGPSKDLDPTEGAAW